jgi:dienelactone hydrolase
MIPGIKDTAAFTRGSFLKTAVNRLLLTLLSGLAATWAEAAQPAPVHSDRTNLLQFVDDAGSLRTVRTAAQWAPRRDRILRAMEEVMGPVPRRWQDIPLDMRVEQEEATNGFTRRKITYQVEPADRVSAWLLVPQGRRAKSAAVLCLHQTTPIGKDEPAGLGGNPDLHYAAELARRGFVTLAPDYWTFGDYRGKSYNPYHQSYVSASMKGIWTHMRSLDLLQSLPEVDGERLGCIGHSLGGHNALWLAAFDPRLKVVVTSCGFNSFASYAASPYGRGSLANYAQDAYMPRVASLFANDPARMPFDFPEVLAAIAPRTLFINAPTRDENFVLPGVTRCVVLARPVYQLWQAATNLVVRSPDVGHSFPKEVREEAYQFIRRSLP